RANGQRLSGRTYVLGPPERSVRVQRDLLLDAARPDLAVDLYSGSGPGPHPFVLTVHGGSWRGGDKGSGASLSRALAGLGLTVFDVRYGLAPAHPFPAAVSDVKCVLGRIAEQSGFLGIDP